MSENESTLAREMKACSRTLILPSLSSTPSSISEPSRDETIGIGAEVRRSVSTSADSSSRSFMFANSRELATVKKIFRSVIDCVSSSLYTSMLP